MHGQLNMFKYTVLAPFSESASTALQIQINISTYLGPEQGGYLETSEVRTVEDVHEGHPGVGLMIVPDCAPHSSPDHSTALSPDLLPHHAR